RGRLDRGGLVDHPGVIQEQQRPWFEQGETLSVRPFGLEYPRLSTLDAVAPDQDDGNEIHAVPMRAFRRWPADAVGGVDAELVRLHVPGLHAVQRRTPLAQAAQQRGPGREIGRAHV